LQNEITGRIAVALNFALVRSEAARPTANPDALDYMFRGRAVLSKPPSRDSRDKAISLFERALALDPQSAQAKLLLVNAFTGRVLDDMSTTVAADIARSEDLVRQALVADPNSPSAHFAKAGVLRAQRQYADAIPEYETVIALDRNSPGAYANLGQCKFFTGFLEEVIPLVEQAVRLSPRDPSLGYWWGMVGEVHLLQSRTDESILWLEKARSANPAHTYPHIFLASAYGLKGANERAAAELAEARRLCADGRYTSIARQRAGGTFRAPKVRALREATFFAGLRKAGMPEE
jgi:adenylate cyclase